MKVCNMTEGRPLKLILTVALPLMVGNIFQQLYTVMDAQIVGMVEGVNALAALGSVDWFNWMFLAMVQGFAPVSYTHLFRSAASITTQRDIYIISKESAQSNMPSSPELGHCAGHVRVFKVFGYGVAKYFTNTRGHE